MKLTEVIVTGLAPLFGLKEGEAVELCRLPAGSTYLGAEQRKDGSLTLKYSEPGDVPLTISVGNAVKWPDSVKWQEGTKPCQS